MAKPYTATRKYRVQCKINVLTKEGIAIVERWELGFVYTGRFLHAVKLGRERAQLLMALGFRIVFEKRVVAEAVRDSDAGKVPRGGTRFTRGQFRWIKGDGVNYAPEEEPCQKE